MKSAFYTVRVDGFTWVVLRHNVDAADRNYASQPNTWRVDSYWENEDAAVDRCSFLRSKQR
ncbi:MAG: hypothetical protein V4510_13060 [bacterium]